MSASPAPGRARHHRRRHHRLQHRLSPGPRPQGRRGADRARKAHQRLDLACRRARRTAPLLRQYHAAAEIQGRALRAAGGGDRPSHRLEGNRVPAARLQSPSAGPSSSARRRPPTASGSRCISCRRRSEGAVAAHGGRRSRRRAFLPTDGQANPADIAQALAKGARAHGAQLIEGVAAPVSRSTNGRVAGVQTDRRRDRLRKGRLAPAMGAADRSARRRLRSAAVGQAPVRDHRAHRRRAARWPPLRDPDRRTYFKEEVGGLVMGGYEPDPIAWATGDGARGFRLPAPRRRLGSFRAAHASGARPHAGAADRRHQADDQRPRVLHARRQLHPRRGAGARSFFVGAGFNAFGIAAPAAPAGRSRDGSRRASRRWISGPSTSAASAHLHRDRGWTRDRTLEAYGKHYTIAWPHEEYESGRPRMVSPLYERLKAQAPVRLEARLGAGELVRAARRRAARHLFLRPATGSTPSARSTAPRASGSRFRPDLLRQIRAARPRRREGAVVDRRQ